MSSSRVFLFLALVGVFQIPLLTPFVSDGETQGARQDTKLTAQDYIENLMVDFLYVFIVSFTLQTV